MRLNLYLTSILTTFFLFWSCGGSDNNDREENNPPSKSQTVKMMTYNIYGARATNPSNAADLEALAKVIKKHNPDFVALQEVDVFTKRSGKDVHQARDLAKLTGMKWHFTKAMNFSDGEYGDAVLSKYEILDTYDFNLPVTEELQGETRSVCIIKVKVGEEELYVCSTHLDHLGNEANRLLQANELKKVVNTIDGKLIVGADMNAVPSSTTMTIVKGYLNVGYNNTFAFTFPSDNPTRTIDYIMYNHAKGLSISNYTVINNEDASDHCPVIATLKIGR